MSATQTQGTAALLAAGICKCLGFIKQSYLNKPGHCCYSQAQLGSHSWRKSRSLLFCSQGSFCSAGDALELFKGMLATDLWPVMGPFSFSQGICLLFIWPVEHQYLDKGIRISGKELLSICLCCCFCSSEAGYCFWAVSVCLNWGKMQHSFGETPC